MKKPLRPRVLLAGLFHETHTFLPGETTLADCDLAVGEKIWSCRGDASPLGGVLEVADKLNWNVLPVVDLRAMPGPIVADEVVDFWWERMQAGIHAALAEGLNGVYLVLHGAMVSRSLPDVEGEILGRIRALVGPDMPIGGVTDLHANFSQRMAWHSNSLVTYRENPHTDARESAMRAAVLLDLLLQSDERAVTHFRQTPILWPPTGTGTADEPMSRLEAEARKLENAHPEILAINVHAGYSFSDTHDAGLSFSLVSVGGDEAAQRALDQLAGLASDMRRLGNVIEPDFQSLLPKIRGLMSMPGDGPIVLAEPSDNIGGGAPGDGTGLLQEFLRHQIGRSAVVINDPAAVERLQHVLVGYTVKLRIGGASDFPGSGPVSLQVKLLARADGHFELEDSQSHLASMYGNHIDMGPCATVRHDLPNGEGILIVLTSKKTPPFDLGQLRSQWVKPENMTVIGVKAAVAHRRAYEPIAKAMLTVATPGPCSSDLKTLPYRQVRRPVFPLDGK